MTAEEQREQAIQSLTDMLRTTPFQVQFKVKRRRSPQASRSSLR